MTSTEDEINSLSKYCFYCRQFVDPPAAYVGHEVLCARCYRYGLHETFAADVEAYNKRNAKAVAITLLVMFGLGLFCWVFSSIFAQLVR